jgi:hypothetical protein
MEKKNYTAPKVIRVKLVVKNAILAVCHSSTNLTPYSAEFSCSVAIGCYSPE